MQFYFNKKKLKKNLQQIFSNNENIRVINFKSKERKLFLRNSDFSYKQIFYKKEKNNFFFAENILPLRSKNFNLQKLAEWTMFAGRTFNNETIYQNVKNLLPGERLTVKKDSLILQKKKYKSYLPKRNLKTKPFINCLSKTINNYFKNYKGNILFGLSGGADSRLLLSLISERNKKRLKCYNYGENHNFEKIISGYIAKFLNFDFENIILDQKVYINDVIRGLRLSSYNSSFQHGYQIKLFEDLAKKNKSRYVILGSALDLFLGSTFSDNTLERIKNKSDYVRWFEKKFGIFSYNEIEKLFKNKINLKKYFRNNINELIKNINYKDYYDLNDALNFETRILRWYNRNLCFINKNLIILNPTYNKKFIDLAFGVPSKLRKDSFFRYDLLKASNSELSKIMLSNNLLPPNKYDNKFLKKHKKLIIEKEFLKLKYNMMKQNQEKIKSSIYDVNLGHKFIVEKSFNSFAKKSLKMCRENYLCKKILNYNEIKKIFSEHILLKKDHTKKLIFIFSLIYIIYDNSRK